MRNVRTTFATVALVAGAAACAGSETARPPPPSPPLNVRPVASTPPARDLRDAGAPDAAPAPPAEVTVRFVFEPFEPEKHSGRRTLFVAAPEIGLREEMGVIANEHRCDALLDPEGRRHGMAPTGEAREMAIACGTSQFGSVRVDGKTVTVKAFAGAPRTTEVAATARVKLDTTLADLAEAPVCPPKKPLVPDVVVQIFSKWETEDGQRLRSIHLRVPPLGIERSFFGQPNIFCMTQRYFAARRIEMDCSMGESGYVVELEVRDGALFSRERHRSYDGGSARPHGGVVLPCGAAVRFPRFTLQDGGWSAFGNQCWASCYGTEAACGVPCRESLTDERGELTDKGQACIERCSNTRERCTSRCGPP